MLKTILLQPSLFHQPETEEMLTRLECTEPTLTRLRNALLEAAHHPSPERELAEALAAHGLEASAAALTANERLLIPKDTFASPARARLWLANLLEAQNLLKLEAEYSALEQECAANPSEEALSRFMMLQQELKARKTQRLKAYDLYGEGA